ncbi:GNAT family N-acetyltransferase [Caldimonas sp. KR1-144]|uniref:GNAT family N-acetyltransferase n=1 Tax=Caldimonas sp. KR1-144 TaxID=3400911 RepID=UPI003BFC228C
MLTAALPSHEGFRCEVLAEADLPALQAFFEANPEYFHAVCGEPPRPDEARQEFDDRPPEDMPYEGVWLLGFRDVAGELVAMASVLGNFLAPGVWHIGLFIVASRLHGSGVAQQTYAALEGWMRASGAQWIRLGAVIGNAKAERFWEKMGYAEVRRRDGVPMGQRVNDLRVFVKPLGAAGVDDYLSVVPRDRPASALP